MRLEVSTRGVRMSSGMISRLQQRTGSDTVVLVSVYSAAMMDRQVSFVTLTKFTDPFTVQLFSFKIHVKLLTVYLRSEGFNHASGVNGLDPTLI